MLNAIKRFYSRKETQYLTYSFHRWPYKLIPQIAKEVIKKYSRQGDTVLDPFCGGGGATLIESNLLKRNVIGLDLNPLACLISRVKTTALNMDELRLTVKNLLKEFYSNLKEKKDLFDYSNIIKPIIPEFPQKDYWFQKKALYCLGMLKALINKIENKEIKEFCLVAFSSIIKQVSNASSLYKLTIRKKIKKYSQFQIYNIFERKIYKMILSMQDYLKQYSPDHFIKIYCKDARDLSDFKNIDLIITQPPTNIFSLDFVRTFKIYFWWLNFGIDIKELDKNLIGSKRGRGIKIKNIGIDFADELVKEIYEHRKHNARILSRYHNDMKNVFEQVSMVLKNNGYCCIYCSDSTIHKKGIMVYDVFCELGKKAGFEIIDKIKREVPRQAMIFNKSRTEELLIFKKV